MGNIGMPRWIPLAADEPMRSTSRTRVVTASARSVLAAETAVLLAVMEGPPPSFAAHGAKAHHPVELWKAFPLGRKAHLTATAAKPVPARRLHANPTHAAPRPSPPRSRHATWPANLAYVLLAALGVVAAALMFAPRRSTRWRRPAPHAAPVGGRLLDVGEQPSPTTRDSPGAHSLKLRVLARLRDAGVLDDEQFAAKQAEALQAEAEQTAALQALVELHKTGLLDDEQFAAKTAEIFRPRRRGSSEAPPTRPAHLAVVRSREPDPP